ncbi:bifunctional 5,10-methylenetetrahydrofolate dehydrogenase/5,10-methenyltetrahydrofolate cyclohydrolase [Candidatus Falkowbacteria bacterium]|nr:bifunctional 5,10-methylenetetrahydrofolate dehydrogenase/5,10-methenyltetrahydrofolate cyclohydrolase [Candidatus Falkowbacteria bacterium]
MKLFDGKKIQQNILKELKIAIIRENLKLKLAVILIGEDEVSKIYIRLKKKAAERIGIGFELYKYEPLNIEGVADQLQGEIIENKQNEILKKIIELNQRNDITGIIVQLPLPSSFDKNKIINAIAISKDVDGFHPENRRLFMEFVYNFEPVFPTAILMAAKEGTNHSLEGVRVAALVNSDTLGQILKLLFEKEGSDFKYLVRSVCSLGEAENNLKLADVVITACGCPGLLTGEMVRESAVVIDGGIYRAKDGKIVGDVERASVEKKAYFLTPVLGGIGPLVIALLLKNVYLAAKTQTR